MNGRLISIVLNSAVSLIAAACLTYLGFFSPVFNRKSERLVPDRWVGTFRIVARIFGPLLCLVAGLKIFDEVRRENAGSEIPAAEWREITSAEGRFRISSPKDFDKEVKVKPNGSESCFRAVLPKIAFLVSYIDLPTSIKKSDSDDILKAKLDELVQAARAERPSTETTRFAGYPAIRFKLRYTRGGYFVEGILLLAKGRRYQLAVDYTSDTSAQDRQRFFNSFQVLDGS